MPESRLAKTRRSLPEGYQFGDARVVRPYEPGDLQDGDVISLGSSQTRFRVSERDGVFCFKPIGWNDMERGEHFASKAERHPVTEGFIAQRDLGDEA